MHEPVGRSRRIGMRSLSDQSHQTGFRCRGIAAPCPVYRHLEFPQNEPRADERQELKLRLGNLLCALLATGQNVTGVG